jgi:hypothetical protein
MSVASPLKSTRAGRIEQLEASIESISARLAEIESELGIASDKDD